MHLNIILFVILIITICDTQGPLFHYKLPHCLIFSIFISQGFSYSNNINYKVPCPNFNI